MWPMLHLLADAADPTAAPWQTIAVLYGPVGAIALGILGAFYKATTNGKWVPGTEYDRVVEALAEKDKLLSDSVIPMMTRLGDALPEILLFIRDERRSPRGS